jgi:hypothetical protein
MTNSKTVKFYLLMLIFHVAHVFEEIWGRFWLLNKTGLGFYLLANLLLFCIPVILFYFVLNKKRSSYILSIGYAAFMALQGIGHNIATIITGKYFDGFAGGFTGIGLFLLGGCLIYYLLKEIRAK